jgi:diaminopimelate decarboxylase
MATKPAPSIRSFSPMEMNLWGLRRNQKGQLVFGGSELVELARTYGTPLYIVDERKVRDNYHEFLNAFKRFYPNVRVFYSYKTNCIPAVLKILHEEGCGAEVISPYELWLTGQLGVSPADVIYNGPIKSAEDLKIAIQKQVGLINVDSVSEFFRIKQLSQELQRRVNVGIRISPGVGWKAHFGLEPREDTIAGLLDGLSRSDLLHLACLHFHIGSGIRKTRDYEKSLETLCMVLRQLKRKKDMDLDYIDIGGGFGVPTVKFLTLFELALYKVFNIPPREPDVRRCPSPEVFGETLTNALKRLCRKYDLREPCLFLEPGRALTSNAQLLLIAVRDIKERRNGTKFAITDGGMQNIAFPLSYEYHKCFLASRADSRSGVRYFVTGPLCSPEDILYRNWPLPEMQRGDILAVMDAGAYFTSFANNFSYPRPAVVLVSDGQPRLIRQQESYEHMSAGDQF